MRDRAAEVALVGFFTAAESLLLQFPEAVQEIFATDGARGELPLNSFRRYATRLSFRNPFQLGGSSHEKTSQRIAAQLRGFIDAAGQFCPHASSRQGA